MPTPRPRYLSRITSPITTAPAAHSPPKPNPCSARKTKSCSKFCAKAQRNVKIEYHRIVICSIRTRPKRSANVPENHPPSDERSNVTVPMSPASPRDKPHSAITVGITKLYIRTSNASSAQPPKQAPIVPRSLAFSSPNQASTVFLLMVAPQQSRRPWFIDSCLEVRFAASDRRLREPAAHDRTKNGVLYRKSGQLGADCSDRDEPGPGRNIEVSRNNQVGQPERGHQHRPGIACRHHCRLRHVLSSDRRNVADHPAAPQHCGGHRKVDNARLDHHETRVLRQDLRAAEHGDDSQARPLHRLDPPAGEIEPSELSQTSGHDNARCDPDTARGGIDDQEQDCRK